MHLIRMFLILTILLNTLTCRASHLVLVADQKSGTPLSQENNAANERPERVLEELIEYNEENGSGSIQEDAGIVKQTILFSITNTDECNSAKLTLADLLPSNAMLTDFFIHDEGQVYKYNKTKFEGNEQSIRNHHISTVEGRSSVLLEDATVAESICVDCSLDSNADKMAVSVTVTPGGMLSVYLAFTVPQRRNSQASEKKSDQETYIVVELSYPATHIEAILYSPNYPKSYPDNAELTWIIKLPTNNLIVQATILQFETNACCDLLHIYDGFTTAANLIAVVSSGYNQSSTVFSTGSTILVKFQSDSSVNGGKFSIRFSSKDKPEAEGDELKYSRIQSITLNQESGEITSLRYPRAYPVSSTITWVILTPSDTYIEIQLQDFDVFRGETLNIRDDFVDSVMQTYQYQASPPYSKLQSSSNKVSVVFSTGNGWYEKRRGFYLQFLSKLLIEKCKHYITLPADAFEWSYLTSPNYPDKYDNNIHCTWIIRTTDETDHVFIELVSADLEDYYDFLRIYDGDIDSGANVKVTITGKGNDFNVLYGQRSFSNTATVRFTSDDSITDSGFLIRYKVYKIVRECPHALKELNWAEGYITNPSYSDYDYISPGCHWLITVEDGSIIKLDIDYIYEYGNVRFYFYDGNSTNADLIWSGDINTFQIADTLTSTTNQLLASVTSSSSSDRASFTFRFESDPKGPPCYCCSPPQATVQTQVFTSPLFPRYYQSGRDCTYLIEAPNAGRISVIIDEFLLPRYDFLAIYDGNSTEKVLANCAYNSNCRKLTRISSSRFMLLILTSDATLNGGFFKIKYSHLPEPACSSSICQTDQYSGVIYSPNFPSDYPFYYSDIFTIRVPTGRIYYEVNYLWTETSADYLTLYDGSDADTTQLERLSGYGFGVKGETSGNTLTVSFNTDGKYNYPGFMISYGPQGNDQIMSGGSSYIFNEERYVSSYFASPGWPSYYPNNADYYWYFQYDGLEYYEQRLYFSHRDIDSSDYLKIFKSFGTNVDDLVFTITGVNQQNLLYRVPSRQVTVWFHSNDLYSGTGFNFRIYVY